MRSAAQATANAAGTMRGKARIVCSLLAASAVAVLLAGVLSATARATGCEDKFTAASGGSWGVSGNWEQGLPTSNTIVCWEAATTVVVSEAEVADSISSGGTLEITGGSLELASEKGGSALVSLNESGGELIGGPLGGSLALSGKFKWSAASSIGSAGRPLTITQTGGGEFAIEGSGQEDLRGASLETTSPITIKDPEFITEGGAKVKTTGMLNFATGLVVPKNGGDNATFTAAGVGANAGPTYGLAADSLVLTGGTTTIEMLHHFECGELIIEGGVLQDDGTLSSEAGTVETKLAGGTLKGKGTLFGSLENTNGTVKPGDSPGQLTVAGSYKQGSKGTLAVEIEGTEPATQFDQLVVVGSAVLEGTLSVLDTGSFTPKSTDTFQIIESLAGLSGTFTTVGGASSALYNPNPAYATHGVTLDAREFPTNTELPAISGSPVAGQPLSCEHGLWSPTPTKYEYQWNRDGAAISGATESTYTVVTADEGHTLTCAVTASDAEGAGAPAIGHGVKIPLPAVPVPETPAPRPTPVPGNTGLPDISGAPVVGSPLSCSSGSWSHDPTSFSRRWYRDGAAIAGATGSSYAIQAADAGHTITCTVTASDAGGSGVPAVSRGLAVPPLLLSCSGKEIELVTVRVKGNSVLLSGLAQERFAGRRVNVSVSGVPRRQAGRDGGSTSVAADGSFVAKLPLPKGPDAGLTRYTATVAGHSSLDLKLGRILVIAKEANAADALKVTFKGTGILAKGSHTITIIREVGCTGTKVFLSKKLGRGSELTVALPAPGEANGVAYYRAQTPTPAGLTYSLPIAVKTGA